MHITVNWSQPSTQVTFYRLQRSTNGEPFVTLLDLPSHTLQYEDHNIVRRNSYRYRVIIQTPYGQYTQQVSNTLPVTCPLSSCTAINVDFAADIYVTRTTPPAFGEYTAWYSYMSQANCSPRDRYDPRVQMVMFPNPLSGSNQRGDLGMQCDYILLANAFTANGQMDGNIRVNITMTTDSTFQIFPAAKQGIYEPIQTGASIQPLNRSGSNLIVDVNPRTFLPALPYADTQWGILIRNNGGACNWTVHNINFNLTCPPPPIDFGYA